MSYYGYKGSYGGYCQPKGGTQWNTGKTFGHSYTKGWGHSHAKDFGGHSKGGWNYGETSGFGKHGKGDWGYGYQHSHKGGETGCWVWSGKKGWCFEVEPKNPIKTDPQVPSKPDNHIPDHGHHTPGKPSENDVVYGTECDDDISTGAGNDTLIAKGGNDILDGESGNDTMIGGKGDDTYYVDSQCDVVIEHENEGNDTILSSVNITAPAHVENISLLTDNDLNAIGNHLNNVLHGNDGKNLLKALEGNDNLYGHAGDDILVGGAGDDFLNGGAGNDILNGGAGCDTYVFARGFDHDVIYDFECGTEHTDTLQFDGFIHPSDLCFERLGNDLVVNIHSLSEVGGPKSEDSVTINNWFKGSEYQIEQFVFVDSQVTWDAKQIADAVGCYTCADTGLGNSVQEQIQIQSQICC